MGNVPYVDISADEFAQASAAQLNLLVLLDTEEKFGMVVDNFLEYEQGLLSLALHHMAWHDIGEWSPSRKSISLINRRLANFLTVSRLYCDHLMHDLSTVYGRQSSEAKSVDDQASAQYKRLFGYRVMVELRNSLQHRSLPITLLQYPVAPEERADTRLLHHRVSAYFKLKDISEDPRFERLVLHELQASHKDTVDLGPYIREYVEGLGHVHQELRRVTQSGVDAWQTTVLGMIQRYRDVYQQEIKRVVLYRLDDKENTLEERHVFLDGIDHLRQQRRRPVPTGMSRWYVSNENPRAI